jgi:hypothetical protein
MKLFFSFIGIATEVKNGKIMVRNATPTLRGQVKE